MADIAANGVIVRRDPGVWFGPGMGHGIFQDNISRRISTQRKPNFTREENLYMIEMFEKHKSLLKSKLMNSSVTRRKLEVWSLISTQLNKRNTYVKRSVDEVKRRWKNLIYFARKRQAAGQNPGLLLNNGPSSNPGESGAVVVRNQPTPPLNRMGLDTDAGQFQANDDSVDAAAILVFGDDGPETGGQATGEWKRNDDENNDEEFASLLRRDANNSSGFTISSVVSIEGNEAESLDNWHWSPNSPIPGKTASKRTLSQSHTRVQDINRESSYGYNSVGYFENEREDTLDRRELIQSDSIQEGDRNIDAVVVTRPITSSRQARVCGGRSIGEMTVNGTTQGKQQNENICVRIKREREDQDDYGFTPEPTPEKLFVNSRMPTQQSPKISRSNPSVEAICPKISLEYPSVDGICPAISRVNPSVDAICPTIPRANPSVDMIQSAAHPDVTKLQMEVLQLEKDKLLMEKENLALKNEKLKYQVLFWKKRSESEITI